MKTKRLVFLIVIIVVSGFLVSCDMINEFIISRTRPLTLVQTYNSNLLQTRRLVPNDNLYVEVQGLEPGAEYTVQCVDPQGNVITEIISIADEEGIIGTSPLWYNIGFIRDTETGRLQLPDSEHELFLRAFNVRVKSNDYDHTDFKIPFFFVSDDEVAERPKPIFMSGKQLLNSEDEETFYLSNAFYADFDTFGTDYEYIKTYYADDEDDPLTDQVFIKIDRLEELVDSSLGARIWVLPFRGTNYTDGEYIVENAYFYNDFIDTDDTDYLALFDYDALFTGEAVSLQWPESIDSESLPEDRNAAVLNPQEKIPEWAEGKAFSLFLDMRAYGEDESGIYHIELNTSTYLDAIDGNGSPAFIVREKVEQESPELVHMNLASNGIFSYDYSTWTYDYGYNDTVRADGGDTLESWRYSVPKGVKVIWNPYIVYPWWGPSASEESVYWGQNVDVYILDSFDLDSAGTEFELTPADGTTKRRVPVQYSCGNGLSQQTIWPAPMITGDYIVVVDMDLNGKLSDGDLVDNLRKNEDEWQIGGNDLGFKVVP
ncbi:MAG: hypothetical protein K9K80_03365 [Spirochaetia bacterium]|nr:hypothetical protein [Spirochaetia bacterium]